MTPDRIVRGLVPAFALVLAACGAPEPPMLGTVEWDVVRLTAPVSERIDAVHVAEGQTVRRGQPVLELDARIASAELAAAEAEATRAERRLAELLAGPRGERIAAARARLQRSLSVAANARSEHARIAALAGRGLLPRSELDRAAAELETAEADVAAARAEHEELGAGTRGEEIAQAEATLQGARAQAEVLRLRQQQLSVTAPRDGRIESLPFEPGDRPASGATLATLLVGEAPHVRLYVPEPLRAQVRPGTPLAIEVDGIEAPLHGRVRTIARQPSFTPYYALAGDDAARLVYLAEVALDAEAAALPGGLPARARLSGAGHD